MILVAVSNDRCAKKKIHGTTMICYVLFYVILFYFILFSPPFFSDTVGRISEPERSHQKDFVPTPPPPTRPVPN